MELGRLVLVSPSKVWGNLMANRLELFRKSWGESKSTWDHIFLKNLEYTLDADNVTKKPYKKSELVYICISTTGKAISQVPLIIATPSGEELKPVGLQNPWQKLFNRPNIYMDRYSFTEALVSFLMLDGNVWIIPFPPTAAIPDSLWVVKRKHIEPIRNPGTNQLIGWSYNPNESKLDVPIGSGIPLAIDEVMHIFFWNPDDPILGQAPLDAGEMSIVTDYKAAKYQQVFFDEGASPGGVLQTDTKLSDKQFRRAKEQFEERHKGFKKGHRVALLEQGLKYTQTGLSQKDMEFYNLTRFTAERIFQILGMKKAVVSVVEDLNYATAREERKEWWQGTNLPIMSLISSAIDYWLESRQLASYYDITKVAALQETLAEKTKTAKQLWQIGFTAEEINERLGMGFGKKPWRKIWYLPVNLMPVPPKGIEHAPATPGEVEGQRLLGLPAPESLLAEDLQRSRLDQIWKGVIARADPLEEQFTKKVSRVFFQMRKRSLKLLHGEARAVKSADDVIKDSYSEEARLLERLVTPLYVTSIVAGVESIVDEVGFGISFDLDDPLAIEFLSTKQLKIRGILETVRKQMQLELQAGLETGETLAQLAARLRNVFNIAESRAKTIARTEIFGSVNFSRHVAIDRSGFGEKQWFTAGDEKVRIPHVWMHGKKVKVGERWVFEDGTWVRFPADPSGAASQVINCRCIETVVPGTHYLD